MSNPTSAENCMLPKRCVVFYHYIRNNPRHKVHHLRVTDFNAQVDFLLENMPPLDPDDVVHCIKEGKDIPQGFLLTFDDGFKEHYDVVYKHLKNRGLRGIFFPSVLPYSMTRVPLANQLQVLIGDLGLDTLIELIIAKLSESYPALAIRDIPLSPRQIKRLDNSRINDLKYFLNFTLSWEISQDIVNDIFTEHIRDVPSFICENYLSVDDIKEMASGGMVFGGHTISHPYLTKDDKSTKYSEIIDSLRFIRELTGNHIYSFCYPFGHYDRDCFSILRDAGIKIAFTTKPADNCSYANRFSVGRFDTVLLPPISKFSIQGIHSF